MRVEPEPRSYRRLEDAPPRAAPPVGGRALLASRREREPPACRLRGRARRAASVRSRRDVLGRAVGWMHAWLPAGIPPSRAGAGRR